MTLFLLPIIILIIVFIIYTYFYDKNYVKSTYDFRSYKVLNGSIESANLLAQLNERVTILLEHMNRLNSPYIIDLYEKFNPDSLIEHAPNITNYHVAYTLNKGLLIGICLTDYTKKPNVKHNINELTFVLLHELSHIASKTRGHDHTFWLIFKDLLNHAIEINIYKPINYSMEPFKYCNGRQVAYSPVYDRNLV
jgi:Zn-dependent protease with chaperone function